MSPDPTEYLTFDQTVEAVNWLTPRRLRTFVAEGVLPKRKVRGRLLFRLDEVAALVEESYRAPNLTEPEAGKDEGPPVATRGP